MIKKIINQICYFILIMVAVACAGGDSKEDVVTSTEYLNVTSQIAISGDGTLKGQLQISADCAWTISGAPSWMSLSSNSGSGNANIEISCSPNPSSTDERSAVLTVTSASGKIKKPVTVTQTIANEIIKTNTNELFFVSDGESKTLAIESNTSWTIKGIEDWISISRTEGNGNSDVTLTTKSNEQETARHATLTIQGANASVRVSIKQDGHVTTLSVSPSVINATAVAGTYELILEGDARWNASINVDWCTLNKLNGSGSDKLSVSVKDNITSSSRVALITIATNQGDKTCDIKQSAGTVPSVYGLSITDVQRYSFKASASFTSEFDVLGYGICYSEDNIEPTINNKVLQIDDSNKPGNVTLTIDGIQSGKTYYVRAFAKNVVGIGYSETKIVKTSGSIPESGDNVIPQI